ncbi:GTPase Era [Rickettsiales endosymbiont of Stachyamoeba lipophora]|uniref:GTPase Era n=1 Tax=Rickettsiales endosymbiont of Stachyamoeba lipophora TaxID=2486578 RepID=UPI000F650B27|nr:GTPase Era [Rickettsiales endosymbiont of Stachyamoeba lipophora]AZL16429.1 GTPase Era [Rickettsiales endosymbiont of Stachyamoeba lipophora]
MQQHKFGTIAIIGCPNAGKSTLLNNLVGSKISIVSPKVQTTRSIIRGIACNDYSQILFIDTPGIFAPKRDLERKIVRTAWSGVRSAEFGLVVIDATTGLNDEFNELIKRMDNKDLTLYIAINKIDIVTQTKLNDLTSQIENLNIFKKIYKISALNNKNTQAMLGEFFEMMPEGEWQFEEDELTDAPSKFIAAEATREQIFLLLEQELPYSCGVETEQFEEQEDGSLKINQIIYVMKDSHKPIVIGNKGSMIKKIGTRARMQLSKIFERSVHLYLFVKVKDDWLNDMDELMIS